MPLTNAQKQEALRKRRAANGLHEIRGIYATQDQVRQIKKYANKIINKGKN